MVALATLAGKLRVNTATHRRLRRGTTGLLLMLLAATLASATADTAAQAGGPGTLTRQRRQQPQHHLRRRLATAPPVSPLALGSPAARKPTYVSSYVPGEGVNDMTSPAKLGDLAVDSNFANQYGDCQETAAGDPSPWFAVDMIATVNVARVELFLPPGVQSNISSAELRLWTGFPHTTPLGGLESGVGGSWLCATLQYAPPQLTEATATVNVLTVQCAGGPRMARYLTVASTTGRPIVLCEVAVYEMQGPFTMVPISGRPTAQSSFVSVPDTRVPDFEVALDGSYAADYVFAAAHGNQAVCFTSKSPAEGDALPWWSVDLGQRFDIAKVIAYQRPGCFACADSRLAGATVRVGNQPTAPFKSNSVCGTLTWPTAGDNLVSAEVTCGPSSRKGRFLSIAYEKSAAAKRLVLCEVLVYAFSGSVSLLGTIGFPTLQSSDWTPEYPASLAQDDDRRTCSSTRSIIYGDQQSPPEGPYWQLDLKAQTQVVMVAVYPRVIDCLQCQFFEPQDCPVACLYRIDGSEVRISTQEPYAAAPAADLVTTVCGTLWFSNVNGDVITVICPEGSRGRYLSIYSVFGDYLNICEVKVYTPGVQPAAPLEYPSFAGSVVFCDTGFTWSYRVDGYSSVTQVRASDGSIGPYAGYYDGFSVAPGHPSTLSYRNGDYCGAKPRNTTVALKCSNKAFSICGEPGNSGCQYQVDVYSPSLCAFGALPPAPRKYRAVTNTDYSPSNNLGPFNPLCRTTLQTCQDMCDNVSGCIMFQFGTPVALQPHYNDCCWLKTAIGKKPAASTGVTAYLPA